MARSGSNVTSLAGAAGDLGVRRVHVLFADQHGLLKGRSVRVEDLDRIEQEGLGVPGSILAKDTGGIYALPVWTHSGDNVLDDFVGARNIVLRPDATTLVPMPWSPATAMVLSDLVTLDGTSIAYSTRAVAQRQLDDLASRGWQLRAGLEFEFHLFRSRPNEPLSHGHLGWDLLGATSLDEVDDVLQPILDGLATMGLSPTTAEVELGPSQVELAFPPDVGTTVGDNAVIIKHAIRCLARRQGCHATFMSRPAIGEAFSAGWHLHQSLEEQQTLEKDGPGGSVLGDGPDGELSETGSSWVGGLLTHAAGSCLLTTPTVTGYKRYRPHAVTPDRVTWSREHRGAMLRVIGAGTGLRIENRAGDPAANPYLYVASQIASGLLGVDHGGVAPAPSDDPYAEAAGPLLPRSLGLAIEAFEQNHQLRQVLGDGFCDYLLTMKRHEWARFLGAVTDWEQQEYFRFF